MSNAILDETRTRSLRLRRPTPYPLGHEDAVVLVTDSLTQAGFEPASVCATASSLVLVKHTKRATNISRFCKDIVEVESLVGFSKGIRSPGAAEAADTRSIAVELLSRLA